MRKLSKNCWAKGGRVNGNFANHPLLQIVYIPRMALTFWGDDVSAPKAPISLAECKAVACKEVVKACHRSTNRSGLRATWFYEGFSLKLYRSGTLLQVYLSPARALPLYWNDCVHQSQADKAEIVCATL